MRETPEEKETKIAREVMGRAIRRLNALEYMILVLAVVLALVGGAVVGWLLSFSFAVPFRWGWAGASLLLFLIPGGVVYVRDLRRPGGEGRKREGRDPDDGGDVTTKPKDVHG